MISIRARVGLAVGATLFCFYLRAAAPTITAGDSGELAAVGATLGIAHSPGYPLYALVGKAVSALIPWANPGYKMNLASALCAAGALGVAAWLLAGFMSWWVAGLACVIGGLTASYAGQALQSEVFSLHGLMASLLVALALSWPDARGFWLVSLLFGLGLGHHHLLLFAAPGLFVLFWKRRFSKRAWAGAAGFFVLGLMVYLYLPVRSFRQPFLDWEDPETFGRFWGVVSRARYGSFQLAQGAPEPRSLDRLIEQIVFYSKIHVQGAGLWMSLLSLWGGLILLQKPWRKAGIFLWLVFLASGPGFFFVANATPGRHVTAIMERFVSVPLLMSSLALGFGLESVRQKGKGKGVWVALVAAALLLGPLVRDFPLQSMRGQFGVWDFGRNILATLPPKAVLFSDRADECEFSLAYLLYAERRRPDVSFTDCNAGVSRSIYGDDYYKIWGPRRLARRQEVERALIAGTPRPVYYATMDTRQIDIPRVPQGLLYEVLKGQKPRPYSWRLFYVSPRFQKLSFRDQNVVNSSEK